ncbi:MAG TPA: hypothetical protein VNQ32_08220 [Steroidobacteraceae bacterium]|nr:hypothetical protein [Steroidobacteraceae bacterium]
MYKKLILSSCILSIFASGCADSGTSSGSVGTAFHEATDKWLGQWTGPEGTYLRLEGGDGDYKVTIQDLDGPKTYQGRSTGKEILFERDGVQESIRATSGAETGMKWLGDKTNCLTIRSGEGYCRD